MIVAPIPSKARVDEVVVDTRRAALFADHAPAGAGLEHPVVQTPAAHAERVVEALVGPGDEAVDRHRNVVHSQLGHLHSLRAEMVESNSS